MSICYVEYPGASQPLHVAKSSARSQHNVPKREGASSTEDASSERVCVGRCVHLHAKEQVPLQPGVLVAFDRLNRAALTPTRFGTTSHAPNVCGTQLARGVYIPRGSQLHWENYLKKKCNFLPYYRYPRWAHSRSANPRYANVHALRQTGQPALPHPLQRLVLQPGLPTR